MLDERYLNRENIERWGPVRYDGPGILLYEYVRGSHAYGLATETSDQDRGGIYMLPISSLIGMTQKNSMYGYTDVIHSDSNDESWYEWSRFGELLCECNPNILESLFIKDEFVIYEHPIITQLKHNRDKYLTKECFVKFGGYAKSQIQKAKGLNKKIVKPVLEKKGPLDFCFTFYNQGSTKIENWLEYRGLKQEYCGLVAIPNMHNTYGVYYDWYNYLEDIKPGLYDALDRMIRYRENPALQDYDFTGKELDDIREFTEVTIVRTFGRQLSDNELNKVILNQTSCNYTGIVRDNSQELCLSSVPEKDARPICYLVYNQEGYSKHAQDYTSYKKWERERNPERYSLNKGHEFDSKNMMHSFRLLTMAIEIAIGEGCKVWRDSDREFLLNIRNHKYTYEQLMMMLDILDSERIKFQNKSTITETINKDELNEFIINSRFKV